jgi:hypothetical protein
VITGISEGKLSKFFPLHILPLDKAFLAKSRPIMYIIIALFAASLILSVKYPSFRVLVSSYPDLAV